MPIYAYRCSACGYAKDQLQKMSDPLLTVCPACGAATFQKQVTAAGFQLKGSGWYVTDFRGGDTAKKPAAGADGGPGDAGAAGAKGPEAAPSAAEGSKVEGAKAASAPPPAKGESGTASAPPPAPASSDK